MNVVQSSGFQLDYEEHQLWTFRWGRDNPQEPAWGHKTQIMANWTDFRFWTRFLKASVTSVPLMPISYEAHIRSRNKISFNRYPNPKGKMEVWGNQGSRKLHNWPKAKQLLSPRGGIPMGWSVWVKVRIVNWKRSLQAGQGIEMAFKNTFDKVSHNLLSNSAENGIILFDGTLGQRFQLSTESSLRWLAQETEMMPGVTADMSNDGIPQSAAQFVFSPWSQPSFSFLSSPFIPYVNTLFVDCTKHCMTE